MSTEQIYDKLNDIFREVFDDDEITVTATTTAKDIDDWDSLVHINLIAAIEQEFGLKFNMGQIITLENVGDMVKVIEESL